MRLSFSRLMVAPLVLALVQPTLGESQSVPSSFSYIARKQEIGLYGGYMTAATGRFGFGPSGGTLFGTRYGIELSGPISFEGAVGVVRGTRDVVDPSRNEGDRVIGQADALTTTIDARLKFSFTGQRAWKGVSPFFTAGGGMAIDASGSSALDDTLLPEDVFDFGTSFFGTVGLGTRWFVSERFALRGDGVFSLWKIDTPPGFSDPTRGFTGVAEGEWVRGISFTVALLYRW
jgi:hypothetical protein